MRIVINLELADAIGEKFSKKFSKSACNFFPRRYTGSQVEEMVQDANRGKKMTNKDKEAVALALMQAAGNLLESYQDGSGRFDGIAHLDQAEVRQCLASWLKRLPGTGWDMRLGKPN